MPMPGLAATYSSIVFFQSVQSPRRLALAVGDGGGRVADGADAPVGDDDDAVVEGFGVDRQDTTAGEGEDVGGHFGSRVFANLAVGVCSTRRRDHAVTDPVAE